MSVGTFTLPACPAAGAGCHSGIMASANRCRHAGLSKDDAEKLIVEALERPQSPHNEVQQPERIKSALESILPL